MRQAFASCRSASYALQPGHAMHQIRGVSCSPGSKGTRHAFTSSTSASCALQLKPRPEAPVSFNIFSSCHNSLTGDRMLIQACSSIHSPYYIECLQSRETGRTGCWTPLRRAIGRRARRCGWACAAGGPSSRRGPCCPTSALPQSPHAPRTLSHSYSSKSSMLQNNGDRVAYAESSWDTARHPLSSHS